MLLEIYQSEEEEKKKNPNDDLRQVKRYSCGQPQGTKPIVTLSLAYGVSSNYTAAQFH